MSPIKNNQIMEETAGSLMRQEYVAIQRKTTTKAAVDYLREILVGMQNIHYVYIINEFSKLVGVLSIRELISSDGSLLTEDVMIKNVKTLNRNEDQEVAAKVFQDTDLVTIPVIDDKGRIAGVVQIEDILDVMQLETTEDLHKMASISTSGEKLEGSLIDATIGFLYRKRIVWLVILVFMNVFSGAGIAHYEDVIANNIALVFFLPLLVDSGGNAGAQSATLVIRSMALGDVTIKDWFKMFTKEVTVSFAMGFTMAFAVSFIGFIRGGIDIAIVVATTMTVIVVIGSIIGMSLPFVFRKFNLDPAAASAPIITSVCDIVGVLTYFGIASWFLGL